jgi:GT2 family glycosyltransferase
LSAMRRALWILVAYRHVAGIEDFVRAELSVARDRGWVVGIHFNHVDVEDRARLLGALQASGVELIWTESTENLGYLTGAAVLYEAVLASGWVPRRTVLSNYDISSVERPMLAAIDETRVEERVQVWGPRIRLARGGREQNPLYRERPSAAYMRLLRWVYRTRLGSTLWAWLSRCRRVLDRGDRSLRGDEFVYAAHGALMVFEEEFFRRGGSLDYRSHLFGEEVHVAEQVRRSGGTALVTTQFEIEHNENVSTGVAPSAQMAAKRARSSRYLVQEYF